MKRISWGYWVLIAFVFALVAIAIAARLGFISEYQQTCEINAHTNQNECSTHYILMAYLIIASDLIGAYHDVLITVATIAVAIFTIYLVRYTKGLMESAEQSRIDARDSLAAVQRASIGAIGLSPLWEYGAKKGAFYWRFRPQWQNTGNTPTRNLRLHVNYDFRDTPLPPGFDFNYPTTGIGTGLIPPNLTLSGGNVPQFPNSPISPQDILDMQAGKKYLYVWGWAKYFDVFKGTPEHITRFCWVVTPVGNPVKFKPGAKSAEPLMFPYLYHSEGNCTDEECAQ